VYLSEWLFLHQTALIQTLPKVDLRRRLEGSLRIATVVSLAREQGLDLPSKADDLRKLLEAAIRPTHTSHPISSQAANLGELIRSESAIREFARQAVEDAARDQIRCLELRFAPAALSGVGGTQPSAVVDWVLETVAQARVGRAILVSILLTIDRGDPIQTAEQVVGIALDRRDQGIAGVFLTEGAESTHAAAYRVLLQEAREAGLGITVDAGAWRGADSVLEAVDLFQASRIGHGIRVMEDPSVVRAVIERQVVFEICLSAEIQSGVVDSIESHPLIDMIQAGLRLTLNTDAPGISSMALSDEYQLALEGSGISMETLKGLILTAAQASFLPKTPRRDLERRLVMELFGG
jgi:adenosine deaminase